MGAREWEEKVSCRPGKEHELDPGVRKKNSPWLLWKMHWRKKRRGLVRKLFLNKSPGKRCYYENQPEAVTPKIKETDSGRYFRGRIR